MDMICAKENYKKYSLMRRVSQRGLNEFRICAIFEISNQATGWNYFGFWLDLDIWF